jgi:hypothetical protein
MPRFLGASIVAGMAGATPAENGGGVRLDGRLLAAPASGAVPLDDRVAYARKVADPDTWDLRAHDGQTEIDLDPTKVEGATTIYAGGGGWAAQTGDGPIRSNVHPLLPIAGLLGMGPEGTLAYRRSFHGGLGLVLRSVAGATTELVPQTAVCREVQVLSATEAVWIQGGRVKATGEAPDLPEGTCGVPRVVTMHGARWLLCFLKDAAGECLILKPWKGLQGHVLTHQGARDAQGRAMWPAYRPDLRVTPDGFLEACWSVTEGEGPTSIRTSDRIHPSASRVDLRRAAPVSAIGRPCWLGFFEFTPASLPGNCELTQVSTWQWRLTHAGKQIAVYVSGEPDGDIAALERSILAVKPQRLPILAYVTRQAQQRGLPRGADFLAVEAYRLATESLSSFETRVSSTLAKCGPCLLVAQCYTSNSTLHRDLASLVPVYAKLARMWPNVVGILAFSGSGRATGWQDHPEIHGLWRELAAGIPKAPDLPKPPAPPTPEPTPVPEDDMPKMTFDESLAVMHEAARKWRDIHVPHDNPHRHLLLDEGQAHIWLWRAVAEGWSREQILEDVK